MNLEIYGASDDLIEIDGDIREEFYAKSYGKNLEGNSFALTRWEGDQIEGMEVHVRYEATGCWSVGISQLEEDKPLPDWGASLSGDGYTAKLILSNVPDDVKLVGPPESD